MWGQRLSLSFPQQLRSEISEPSPATATTKFGKRAAGTETGRPAPTTEPEQPAVPLRFGVTQAHTYTGYQNVTGIDVSSLPHVVYFLEDEETLAEVPSMLPLTGIGQIPQNPDEH